MDSSTLAGAATAALNAPPPAPQVKLAAVAGDGKVTLTWTSLPGVSGWRVSRDGVDISGTGPWSTGLLPPGTNTLVMSSLVNGRAYTFTLSAPEAPTVWTVTATPAVPAAPPPPAGVDGVTAAAALGWGPVIATTYQVGYGVIG